MLFGHIFNNILFAGVVSCVDDVTSIKKTLDDM